MGFFNTILEKLGIGKEAVAAPIPTPAPTSNAEPAASPEPETIPTAPNEVNCYEFILFWL